MPLFDQIIQKSSFKILDAPSGVEYLLPDLLYNCGKLPGKEAKLVFLYLDNSVNSTALYLSFLQTDHTLVLLNRALATELKNKLEQGYHPEIIFDPERDKISGFETFTLANSLGEINVQLSANQRQNLLNKNCKVLLSTSGTTGSPKLVKLSDKNLLSNAESIAAYLPILKDDIVPLNLPLHYSYGLSVLHSNAISGATVVCGLPDILQARFWDYMGKFGFSTLAGVPYVYEMLKRVGFLKKQYPSLRYLTQAGGNLGQHVKQEFLNYSKEHNIDFYIMYGQTEATARISYVPPDQLQDKLTSIGKPIMNGKLYLNEDTSELLYSGPNVFGGYAENREDLAEYDDIPVLHTGDLAYRDSDGYFFIKGRLKRFVKIFGNRVNLDELEAYLKTIAGGSLIACSGLEDQAVLVAHNKTDLDLSMVKQKLFEQFKIHHSVVKFIQLEEFPLTGNGKVDYKKITENYINPASTQ